MPGEMLARQARNGHRPEAAVAPAEMPSREVRQTNAGALRAQQSQWFARAVGGQSIRRRVDGALDLLRLRLDSFPHGVYQPVDLPVRSAKRADGSRSRWAAIRPVVERLSPGSAMDLGANAGYFSIGLGRLGVRTVAVESDPAALRTAALAIRRSGMQNVALLSLALSPESVGLLPVVDATVFLSVWHHLVRHQGLDTATTITRRIWSRTAKVMFFDSGEREMDSSFDLPAFEPTVGRWFADYLARNCPDSGIEHLGLHAAFDADGRPCERNLFAVVRDPRPMRVHEVR